MSMKAARGMKRVCQSCNSKFYDLSRDPIVCPICNTVFQLAEARPKAAIAGNSTEDDDEDEIAAPVAGIEIVSLEEAASEEADIPDIEDSELVEIDEEDSDLGNEETFIEVEDDDNDDVTGIVSGSREEDDE